MTMAIDVAKLPEARKLIANSDAISAAIWKMANKHACTSWVATLSRIKNLKSKEEENEN